MKRMRRRATALVLALAMMLSCGINVFAAADRTRHNFEIEIEYTGDTGNDRVDLGDAICDELYDLDFIMEYYEIGTDDDGYDLDNELLYYGRVNSSDVYIADPDDDALADLDEDGELHEEYIYYVAEDDYGNEYYGRIAIVLVKEGGGNTSTDEDLVYELDCEDSLYLGERMILDLEYLMDDDVDCIEFDIPSDAGDCGELYYYDGSDWEYLDESAVYYATATGSQMDLTEVYFESNDEGGEYFLYYKAYFANEDPLEGTVTINCGMTASAGNVKGAKYTIDSVAVRSPLTNSLLDAIPHNDFYAEVAVTNVSSNSTDLLLLAVYAENGEMIDLSFLYANPQVGQTVTFGTLVDNDDGRAYRIKAFMWSSLVNPVPLAEAKAFPEELPDLSGDVVLGYKIIPGMLNGQLMNALMPDATAASMSVVSLDGVKWDQAAFAVPEFFLHRTNELGQSTLTSLKTSAEYRACGIYAGLVSKYTYKTGTITLDNGTELTEAEAGFTLYDSHFAANASALEMLDKNEPYIFYAPEGKAVYGVHISGEALEALYVKLGGTLPEAVIPDITIEAGLEQLVGMDADLFQEYLDEELGSAQYDVVFVTISDAPCSSAEGYLAISGENLTTRGDKSFYVNPEIDEYDLNDLQYQAGSRTGDYDAVFTLYYQHGADGAVDTIEGVIRFEVQNSTSISTTTPLKASQVMSFAYELAAIRNLGGNDNEYIKFISLPINGKLYYDFGTATQKDVVIGEEYHLTEGDGNLQLSRVTYVPSYSASKVMKYDTIAVKCFDKMDIGVKGSINIAIQHAQYSAQFTDVKDAKYADSVDFVYNREIAAGMTATTFGLTEKVTRGQFITFLYRAAGAPDVAGMVNSFTDVKSSDYYYNAVMWADKYNLIADRSTDTTFDPTSPVTHQEMLTFMYYYDVSYLGHYASLGSASYVYDYANVDTWAQLPVKWAVGKGIIDYGNLLPREAGTRATVALWLHRMLTL